MQYIFLRRVSLHVSKRNEEWLRIIIATVSPLGEAIHLQAATEDSS
jgi:hypothetical protein